MNVKSLFSYGLPHDHFVATLDVHEEQGSPYAKLRNIEHKIILNSQGDAKQHIWQDDVVKYQEVLLAKGAGDCQFEKCADTHGTIEAKGYNVSGFWYRGDIDNMQ